MTARGLTAPTEPRTAERSPARFWATAYTLLCLLTGTNLPTPLYRGYEREFGFSPLVVTLIFAVYVASLIPSLPIAGPLSDSVGRRTVLLPAVTLAALGSLAFALTAALTELEPGGDRGRAALVSAVASVGGLGTGPLIAGPARRVRPLALRPALRPGDRAAGPRGHHHGHPSRHPAHDPLATAPPHHPGVDARAVPLQRHGELPRLPP
ncbi:MFS transporter [Streptomyces achromogenes]|uniref:MFS transporter n=1 Tax=Streptomyces achromogenes TaxID=67255 RepID=UPI0036F534F0